MSATAPIRYLLPVAIIGFCARGTACADVLGTAFTYQGQLRQDGVPVNGTVNMAINLWDAASGGNLVGPVMDPGPVVVTRGLFTVSLNYGNSFNGDARWLEITVNGTVLAPRQPITATPYALFAAGPWLPNGQNLMYAAGNVGIGMLTAPAAPLEVWGSNPFPHLKVAATPLAPYGAFLSMDATAITGGKDYLIFSTGNSAGEGTGKLVFKNQTEDTVCLALTANGRAGIGGTTAPSTQLEVDATSASDALRLVTFAPSTLQLRLRQSGSPYDSAIFQGTSGQIRLDNDASGIATSYAQLENNGTWSAPSDARLKEDVQPLSGLLAKATALRPVSFRFRNQEVAAGAPPNIGFIAQEVEPVLPELVHGRGDELRTLDYSGMSVVAIGALQELNTRMQSALTEKDRQISDLTARLERLEAALAKMQPGPTK